MDEKIPYLVGHVSLKSELSIEEVGEIIAERLFGGLKFVGKELEIYEEVPAVRLEHDLLSLEIILQGYSGLEETQGFSLGIHPYLASDIFKGSKFEHIRLDRYLALLFKDALKDVGEIQVKDIS